MKRIFKSREHGDRHDLLELIMVANNVVETNLLEDDRDKREMQLTASSIVNAMCIMESALFELYPESVIEEAYRSVDCDSIEEILNNIGKLIGIEDL